MEAEHISYIRDKRSELLDFARSRERIFLYGAGNIAKAFIDVFQNENMDIDGLITTNGEIRECRGYQVFSAEEAKKFLKESDGVIPAFGGAAYNEISDILHPASPQILCLDCHAILAMDDDIRFLPIVRRWNNEFGKADILSNPREWKKVLVARLDVVGDMVFTTPFLRELRRNLPDSEITLVARRQNGFLVKNCPYVSKVLLYECPFQEGELSRQCENIEEAEARARKFAEIHFKEKDYDAVFFPRELLTGRNMLDEFLLGYLCGAKIRIGKQIALPDADKEHLREIAKNAFSLISLNSGPMHEAQYALKILENCGLHVEDECMELWLSEEDRQSAAGLIGNGANGENPVRIALGLVASVASRTWSAENYAELARMSYAKDGGRVSFVLMGGTDALEAAGIIHDGLGEERKIIIDIVGKTNLAQSAACMELCDLYVGSNTGLLHFASALHKPSVTLYAALPDIEPTDGNSPQRMGAWKVPHIDLIPPAGLDGCRKACRMNFSHCINQITPGQVLEAVRRMLGLGADL